ncbi:ATP-binding cassette domain-containing protein [Candidatus Gracilibacteria bacterium]|nr:ATP-binding cassette domain-containing protein [Candidatus Gracilibacteria bacterium]
MSLFAIEAQGLEKRYGDVVAVAGIDLGIESGQIYAMLGPNGAGKTTTINMLTTLTRPSAGTARVAGFDILREADRVRTKIGVTFQDIVLDQDLSGRQVLDFHGRLYRMDTATRRARIVELVELVQLGDAIDRKVKTYSGGMKRRLELARGLMTEPAVLFLDEPTQGLDPQNRAGIWGYVRELNTRRGLTLLLTTHYMEEAEALADSVGIVDHGRLVIEGRPNELVAQLGSDLIRVTGQGDAAHFLGQLRALPFVSNVQVDAVAQTITIAVDQGNRRLVDVVTAASGNGYQVDDLAVTQPSLGDVFLHHTGRALRD